MRAISMLIGHLPEILTPATGPVRITPQPNLRGKDTDRTVLAGERCERLLAEKLRGLKCDRLELDEIWTFCPKKQKRMRPGDGEDCGDQFVFVAIDPVTKLVPAFAVGKRSWSTAVPFVQQVRERTTGAPQITTDGFKPYIRAIDDAFGADVDYAVLVKTFGTSDDGAGTYHPSRIVGIFH